MAGIAQNEKKRLIFIVVPQVRKKMIYVYVYINTPTDTQT